MEIEEITSLPRQKMDPTVMGVYFLFNHGELVYIGQSVDIHFRVRAHVRDGKAFDEMAFIELPESSLNKVEKDLILKFKPPYNKHMLVKPKPRVFPDSVFLVGDIWHFRFRFKGEDREESSRSRYRTDAVLMRQNRISELSLQEKMWRREQKRLRREPCMKDTG